MKTLLALLLACWLLLAYACTALTKDEERQVIIYSGTVAELTQIATTRRLTPAEAERLSFALQELERLRKKAAEGGIDPSRILEGLGLVITSVLGSTGVVRMWRGGVNSRKGVAPGTNGG